MSLKRRLVGGGDRKSPAAKEDQLPQSEGDDTPTETAERLAKKHNISRSTVERSADLYKAHRIIRDVDPNFAQRFESGKFKVPQKDILTLGKALQLSTPEQRQQIVSELKDDPEKAIDIAKEVAAQSKPEDNSPEPEATFEDHIGDIIANPEVNLTESNSDLETFQELAERIYCPKCGKKALTALKWSCCGLSINEAANRPDGDVEDEPTSSVDSADGQVEERSYENGEFAGTAIADCAQKEPKCYSDMVSWIPPDNSSLKASKILRMFSYLLKKDEAPRADSLAKMTGLPIEVVRDYLENASWVRKDDSSPDGTDVYLPIEPSRTEVRTE